MNLVKRLFGWQGMLKESEIEGPIPSNRQIYRKTLAMAWPSALEMVLIALIGAVDTAMVGTLNKEAISAVGICTQPRYMILAPIFALNIGVTVLVARRRGEKKQAEANSYLNSSLAVCALAAVILSVLGIIFAEPFLRLAGAGDDYIDLAVLYFRITEFGNIFYSISLTISAGQRGIGNTRISMITNLAANIINLIFNALLINGLYGFPKLGVQGAAIATAIGNIVACLIAIISVLGKKGYLHLHLAGIIKPSRSDLNDIWQISRHSLVEQVFMRIGFFVYSKAVASLGTVSYSAHQVCMNIMNITFSFGDGLQVANTSLVGQSMGQRRIDMAQIYTGVAKRIGMVIAIVIAIVIAVFSTQITELFTNDAEVIAASTIPLMILSVTVLFQIPQVIVIGALRGAGDVKFVAALMLISVTIIRPGLAYLLAYPCGLGLLGAWIGLLVDQITRNLVSNSRLKKGSWKRIAV